MPIMKLYKDFFKKNKISLDDTQKKIMGHFCDLHKIIDKYKLERATTLKRYFTRPKVPKGIYLWGEVGRGKSMLAETFFANVNLVKKRKLHFHTFMLEIHEALRKKRADGKKFDKDDYLKDIAENFASRYRLLFIDELQITDIADAMIVGKLFRELFKNNIMIITTSNRKPDDLYYDGIQRESFLVFIDLIKQHLEVLELNSNTDYRLEKIKSMSTTYFTPLNKKTEKKLEEAFMQLNEGEPSISVALKIKSRKLICQRSSKHVVFFTFDELCKRPLGSSDYLAICKSFDIIILSSIPKLKAEDRNEAKRFVTLIDTIYDQKKILICSSEVAANEIYVYGDGRFEFSRTVSRLIEMQSKEYLEGTHG